MIFWTTGRGFRPSRSCEQMKKKSIAANKIVRLDSNSRLIEETSLCDLLH